MKTVDKRWIACDLDRTLAFYDTSIWSKYNDDQKMVHIGEPIPKMLKRVKKWLAKGIPVRIFTARADKPEAVKAIKKWCKEHVGQELPVTNVKDRLCKEIWDDRAVGVIPNTGKRVK